MLQCWDHNAAMDHCLEVLQEELPPHPSQQHWQWQCIPKSKPDFPLLPSLKVLSPAPGAPVGQHCSEQRHRAPWIPEQGTAAALKGEYSSLYPACETQNSDCCLGWQKTQSLLPNWPTKPFCKGPGSFTLLMAPSIKELKALLFEPRRPEAYLKKMYI